MPAHVIVATLMRQVGETGVQSHFQSYLQWMKSRGQACEVLTPYQSPLWQVYPVFAVRRLIDRLSGTLSVWWYRHWHAVFLRKALQRRLKRTARCVVYAQCPLSAGAALAARRSADQKVVLVVHFNVSQATEWAEKGLISASGRLAWSIAAYEAKVLPAVDGLVYVSEFMQAQVNARIPAANSSLSCVVPNFTADPGPTDNAENHDADLLSIGTLEPRKNQAYALQIVAAAQSRGQTIRLTIAGDGPDRKQLEARAAQLGISHLVRFLGAVPNAARLFKSHKACLHVAQMESFGIVLIEAMAHGLPVFATPVGGMTEVFTDHVEGRFVPLNDPQSAAVIISQGLNDSEFMQAAGLKARHRFLCHYSSEIGAANIDAFLQRVSTSSQPSVV